jgi:hypothetical protein
VLEGLPERIVWCRLQLAAHRLADATDVEGDAVTAAGQAAALLAQIRI